MRHLAKRLDRIANLLVVHRSFLSASMGLIEVQSHTNLFFYVIACIGNYFRNLIGCNTYSRGSSCRCYFLCFLWVDCCNTLRLLGSFIDGSFFLIKVDRGRAKAPPQSMVFVRLSNQSLDHYANMARVIGRICSEANQRLGFSVFKLDSTRNAITQR